MPGLRRGRGIGAGGAGGPVGPAIAGGWAADALVRLEKWLVISQDVVDGGLGAGELRVKETDRIATVVENLRRMGITAEASADGLIVPGRQRFRAAAFDSFGDHRIAMAFAVAALRSDSESTIDNADSASVSFPGFFTILRQISA